MTESQPWSDDPVHSSDQDQFGRSPFAALVAETIDAVRLGSASTVFGLVGPWGSGKSSVAAMVREALPSTWITTSFTPWSASGTAELQLEFVAVLDKALGGALQDKKRAKRELKRYVDLLSPLVAVAGGSGLARLVGTAASNLTNRKPWSEEFGALSQSLEAMEQRVLIVCDDIDRLDAPELLQFLKVVRLLGRFPNIHYLVAYDADTVEDLLAAEGISGRTSSFMEKIVQHPFELPQIDVARRWHHLSETLNRALGDHEISLGEEGISRYRLLVDRLAAALKTPRQIARYEQHLRAVAKLIPGEVDMLDFAALAYLRLNHHEVYEALSDWAPKLRAGLSSDSTDAVHEIEKWNREIRDISRRKDVAGVWPILVFLFPSLDSAQPMSLHPQALADPVYEERYFSLGIPSNDLSDVLGRRALRSLLEQAEDQIAESQVLTQIKSVELVAVRVFLNRLWQQRTEMGDTQQVSRLVSFLQALQIAFEPTRGDSDSPVDLIFEWLGREVLRGYSSGEFNRVQLLERFGEGDALKVVMRAISVPGASKDARKARLLADFAQFSSDSLARPGALVVDSPEMLRAKIALQVRAAGHDAMRNAFDDLVDGDLEAFLALATAMVTTEAWYSSNGSRTELAFDPETWMLLVSNNVRTRMTAQMPAEADEVRIDDMDLSDSNRRRYAMQTLRAMGKSAAGEA
ncbi:KAP family P-loop NTPase fold protein [Microbacterium sp. Root322]|uniref:KAP family P-loop NTPase fold protein n=1 Tax=Microbacterium sp. Root322 TaxID=1736514 RepID=UPI00138F6865|nr:P-loop NTPase fold protein [Microbacterium sp. Root322]